MQEKVAIIGCGSLGQSLANGLLSSGYIAPQQLILTKRNTSSLHTFEQKGVWVTSSNKEAVDQATIILVALKPYTIETVLNELSPYLSEQHVLISVATGISLEQLHKACDGKIEKLYRAMPNTATDVQHGITAITAWKSKDSELTKVEALFKQLGEVLTIDEHLMEAFTILGACGIAYVMRFIRAMVQGGIQIGFSAEMAAQIVNHTVHGAAELLLKGNQHPETEIDKVTTPKGCTITGLNEMEHNGFSSSLIKGIVKSFEQLEK